MKKLLSILLCWLLVLAPMIVYAGPQNLGGAALPSAGNNTPQKSNGLGGFSSATSNDLVGYIGSTFVQNANYAANAGNATNAGTAGIANSIVITTTSNNQIYYPLFVPTTGTEVAYDSGGLSYDPAQGTLTASGGFAGICTQASALTTVCVGATNVSNGSGCVNLSTGTGNVVQSGSVTPLHFTYWSATGAINDSGLTAGGNGSQVVTSNASAINNTIITGGTTNGMTDITPTGQAPSDITSGQLATHSWVQTAINWSMATYPLNLGTNFSGNLSFNGNGSGLVVSISVTSGAITAATLVAGGANFAKGDLVTVAQNGSSFDAVLLVGSVNAGGAVNTNPILLYGGSTYTNGFSGATALASSVPFTYALTGSQNGLISILYPAANQANGGYRSYAQQFFIINNLTGGGTNAVNACMGINDAIAGACTTIIAGNNQVALIYADGVANVYCVTGSCTSGAIVAQSFTDISGSTLNSPNFPGIVIAPNVSGTSTNANNAAKAGALTSGATVNNVTGALNVTGNVTASGNGNFSQVTANGGALNNLTSANLAVTSWASGTWVHTQVWLGANLAFNNTIGTNIPYNEIQFDTTGTFNTTNGAFDAPVNGFYTVHSCTFFATPVNQPFVYIAVNGVQTLTTLSANQNDSSVCFTSEVQLVSGSLLQMQVQANFGTGNVSKSPGYTWIDIRGPQ